MKHNYPIEADKFVAVNDDTASEVEDLTINGDVVIFANIPTSDPGVAGQLYSDSGVVTVSAGT